MDVIFNECIIDYIQVSDTQTSFIVYDGTEKILSFVRNPNEIFVAEVCSTPKWTFKRICESIDLIAKLFNIDMLYLEENCVSKNGIPLTLLKIASVGYGIFHKYGFNSRYNNYDEIKDIIIYSDGNTLYDIKTIATKLLEILKQNSNSYQGLKPIIDIVISYVVYDKKCTKLYSITDN